MIAKKVNGRKPKSDWLSKEEAKGLGSYVKECRTIAAAADQIGVSRQVLDRVLLKGSGSPENIAKVRAAISAKV